MNQLTTEEACALLSLVKHFVSHEEKSPFTDAVAKLERISSQPQIEAEPLSTIKIAKGVELRPFLIEILDVELARGCIQYRALDTNTGEPLVNMMNLPPDRIFGDDPPLTASFLKACLVDLMTHEADELIRTPSGEFFEDPHPEQRKFW